VTPPPSSSRSHPAPRGAHSEPVQEFFSIGEVCDLTGLKPHVLRYWESQFRFLNPAKNRSGNRVYQRREVELVMLVKHLLYDEKYTIEGARQKVDEHRKSGDLKVIARGALTVEALESLEGDLRDLVTLLDSLALAD
jgi:DNA-binding transcriptional MerR regulator